MNGQTTIAMNQRTLITVLLLICAAIVVAGLWPFDFHPENNVRLLREEKGIRLFGVGNARSREPFSLSDTVFRNGSFSLEILVRPHQEPSHDVPAMISLCDRSGKQYLFIGQWKSTLIIRSPGRSSPPSRRYREIGVADALRRDQTRLITVTASENETVIFLDGDHVQSFPRHSLLPGPDRHTGYLVIGNVRSGDTFWSGDLLGLRIYDRALQKHEVRLYARQWPKTALQPSTMKQGIIAEYDFDHRDSPFVVNRSGSLPDLAIADAFQPVRRARLQFPRARDWWTVPAAVDVFINVAGFVPFGFFFSLLLRRSSPLSARHAGFAAVAAGAAISLAIEVTQTYLPPRDSSAADLVFNVLGTIIGAIVLIRVRYVPER